MLFAIYCLDKSGHAQVRANNRDAHLAYLDKFADKIVTAGPLLDQEGKGMIGSLLIMDLADRRTCEEFAAGDPYAKAGLFASARITPWRKTRPAG
jgi:uncharacterized protein